MRTLYPILNLPNILSMLRVFAIPLVIITVYQNTPNSSLFSGIIFGLICFTDMLDGYIARKYDLVSKFGKWIDPLADKLLVIITLIILMKLDRVWFLLVMIIIFREVSITGLRAIASDEKMVIKANHFGKQKTAFQMFGIAFLLVHYDILGFNANDVGTVLLWISVAFSLVSAYQYSAIFIRKIVLRRQ